MGINIFNVYCTYQARSQCIYWNLNQKVPNFDSSSVQFLHFKLRKLFLTKTWRLDQCRCLLWGKDIVKSFSLWFSDMLTRFMSIISLICTFFPHIIMFVCIAPVLPLRLIVYDSKVMCDGRCSSFLCYRKMQCILAHYVCYLGRTDVRCETADVFWQDGAVHVSTPFICLIFTHAWGVCLYSRAEKKDLGNRFKKAIASKTRYD